MKQLLIAGILFLFANLSFSQDIIYLKTNEQIKAKVTEVGTKSIWYKKFDHIDGPEYELSKKEITIIIYENGSSDQFNTSNTPSPENNAKNVISFNFGDLTVSRVALSYERFVYKHKLSVKIPISLNYTNTNNYDGRPRVFSGIDLNFYPLGLGKVSYFTGIGTQAGTINQYSYYPYYDYYGYTYYPTTTTKYYTGAYINNGVTIIPIENFSVSGQLGIGFRDLEGITRAEPSVIGQLNISARF